MSFDLLAPHYRWMEWVLAGGKLQRCRAAFLDRVQGARNVLTLGEANGRFLVECRRSLPQSRITCVDASRAMLVRARERLRQLHPQDANTEFIQADVLNWTPPCETYDLIATHFFLDCFRAEQLEGLLERIANSARPRCHWLIADFQVPASGFRRWRARWILRLMYAFFRRVTGIPATELTSPDSRLAQFGFTLNERRVSEWGLLRSDWWTR